MIKKAVKDGLLPFRVPLPATCNQWMENNFKLTGVSSSIEGPWTSFPYQVGPANWMGNDDIKSITWKKSARLGCTKLMVGATFYLIEHKKRNGTIYQPTDGDAQKFADDEIKPILIEVPAIRNICKSDPEKKSSNFTTERKKFIWATLDILGGKSARNYRRYTKDFVIFDELSGFDSDVEGEGSPTSLGDKRTETSSFPKSIKGSTPKIKGSCLISGELEDADMVMYRYVPCPDCEGFQILQWKNFHFESVKYICEFCGSMIGYEQYPDMDKYGQWRTLDGTVYYDEELDRFFNHKDEQVPDPESLGIVLWSAYSYFQTWLEMIKRFKRANKKVKRTGDFTELKTFINTVLGEEWEERGEKVNETLFEGERLEQLSDKISNDIFFITMGVDVQGGKNARLEYEVCGWGVGEESWSLDYGKIHGDPNDINVWDHLDKILFSEFCREDGVVFRISRTLVDSGYIPDVVYNYTTPRQKYRVYASKGYSQSGKAIATGKFSLIKKKTRLYMIGADTAKEILYTRLNKIVVPGPGFCHFPNHYPDEYFLGLASEEKVTKRNKRSGRSSYEWVKVYDRNEPLDLRVLNMAALKIDEPDFAALKYRTEREAERIRLNITRPPQNNRGRRVRSKGAA